MYSLAILARYQRSYDVACDVFTHDHVTLPPNPFGFTPPSNVSKLFTFSPMLKLNFLHTSIKGKWCLCFSGEQLYIGLVNVCLFIE